MTRAVNMQTEIESNEEIALKRAKTLQPSFNISMK